MADGVASENELNDDEDSRDGDYDNTNVTKPASKSARSLAESHGLNSSGRVPYSSAQLRSSGDKRKRLVAENKGPLQYWSQEQKTFIYERWKRRSCSTKDFATILKAEGIRANMWDDNRVVNANIVAGIIAPLRRREIDEKGEITPAPAVVSHHPDSIAESPVPVSETSSPEEGFVHSNGSMKADDSQLDERIKLLAAEPTSKRQRNGPSTPPALSHSTSDDGINGSQRSQPEPARNHNVRRQQATAATRGVDHLEGEVQLCREEVRAASLKVERIINVLKLLSAAKTPPPAQN